MKLWVIIAAAWKLSNEAEFVVSWEAMQSSGTGTPQLLARHAV